MCDLEFDGSCSVWEEKLIRRARKGHRCSTCSARIAVGQSYMANFFVCDGDAANEKQCLPCRTIGDAFTREHGSSVTPGSLLDFLEQCLDEERFADDGDDDETKDGRPSNRSPSRLSDEGLRWKYAMVEIRGRNAAASDEARA